MDTKLRIGTWPHWLQPAYKIATRIKEKFGIEVVDIDFKKPGYLDNLDVVIIEQNGYNDFIENEQAQLQDFARKGGICWIMHQDHERWTPHFLPDELAYPILIHRYFQTGGGRWEYLMPWIEESGKKLFEFPNRIEPEEMVYWECPGNSLGHPSAGYEKNLKSFGPQKKTEVIKSTAISCIINTEGWEILGSYRDSAVCDGALIIKAGYGKGLFLWNQILFPEEKLPDDNRILSFWDKYAKNVLNYFETFKGIKKPARTSIRKVRPVLPEKVNYKMITHIHCLGWWGAGSSPGTINAAMRYHNIDIAALATNNPFASGKPVLEGFEKYNDSRVLFLPGQEIHPFNWEGGPTKRLHILNMGTEVYTRDLHKSLFTMKEIDTYVKKAIAHIKNAGGAATATHSSDDYWTHYDFDAVDMENPPKGLAGSLIEKFYLSGGKITTTIQIDMWGIQRLKEYPAFNFIYIDGAPCKETVLDAIRKGHLMPAIHIESADIRLGQYLPGDSVPLKKVSGEDLSVTVVSQEKLKKICVYCRSKVIFQEDLDSLSYQKRIKLDKDSLKGYLRVEVKGDNCAVISNPFYLE